MYQRFTTEEVDRIRRDYAAGVETGEIARSLNRSDGVIRQKILHLGLTRAPGLLAALRYAPPELIAQRGTMTDDEFIAAAKEWRRGAKSRAKALRDQRVRTEINAILAAGGPRRAQMRSMRDAGATLEEIAQQFGITRERVRQIVDKRYLAKVQAKGPPIRTILRVWKKMTQPHREAFLREIGAQMVTESTDEILWS